MRATNSRRQRVSDCDVKNVCEETQATRQATCHTSFSVRSSRLQPRSSYKGNTRRWKLFVYLLPSAREIPHLTNSSISTGASGGMRRYLYNAQNWTSYQILEMLLTCMAVTRIITLCYNFSCGTQILYDLEWDCLVVAQNNVLAMCEALRLLIGW